MMGLQVAAAAAAVPIPEFKPALGVQIETDPKATSDKPASGDLVDDEA